MRHATALDPRRPLRSLGQALGRSASFRRACVAAEPMCIRTRTAALASSSLPSLALLCPPHAPPAFLPLAFPAPSRRLHHLPSPPPPSLPLAAFPSAPPLPLPPPSSPPSHARQLHPRPSALESRISSPPTALPISRSPTVPPISSSTSLNTVVVPRSARVPDCHLCNPKSPAESRLHSAVRLHPSPLISLRGRGSPLRVRAVPRC